MKDTGKKLPKIDPEKLFNEKEYSTLKIGGAADGDTTGNLLALLASKTTGEKDLAIELLKKEKATSFLVNAIKECKNPRDKALLLAACWESGLEFKAHLEFFARLVHDADLFVSMEASTVVAENIADVDKTTAQQLIDILDKATEDHFNAELIRDVIARLKDHL